MHTKRLLFPLIGLLLAGGYYAAGVRHARSTHRLAQSWQAHGQSRDLFIRIPLRAIHMHYVYTVDGVSYDWTDARKAKLPADI